MDYRPKSGPAVHIDVDVFKSEYSTEKAIVECGMCCGRRDVHLERSLCASDSL